MLSLMLLGSLWDGWKPANCVPFGCFCEAVRAGLVRQPVNTLSASAFLFVAAWVLWHARRDRLRAHAGNLITRERGYAIGFALCLIVLGLATAFYHASLTFAGQLADNFGMYLLATFILLCNVARQRSLGFRTHLGAYLGTNTMLGLLIVLAPVIKHYLFAGLIAAALAVEYLGRRRSRSRIASRLLYGSLALLAVAFSVWVLDNTGVFCAPHSVLQGHAIWHLLDALAAALLYQYYRSEEPEEDRQPDWALLS